MFFDKKVGPELWHNFEQCHGNRSIAGNVTAEDVFSRLTNPHCYPLDIIKSLFSKRDDSMSMMVRLSAIVGELEVILGVYVFPNTHHRLYDPLNFLFFVFMFIFSCIADVIGFSSAKTIQDQSRL